MSGVSKLTCPERYPVDDTVNGVVEGGKNKSTNIVHDSKLRKKIEFYLVQKNPISLEKNPIPLVRLSRKYYLFVSGGRHII